MKNSNLLDPTILGIDAGSVSVSIAAIDHEGHIIYQATAYHHGDVKKCLANLLSRPDLPPVSHMAKTASTPSFVNAQKVFDEQVSIIRTAKQLHGDSFSGILHIGGENFSLSLFDTQGNYIGARRNSSCAAGTGSFLDQQAGRLHLAGSAQISEQALSNRGKRPDIATRCAVFAKTDLIHAQQEGYNIAQISDGLCFGLAKNISNTLFGHTQPLGRVLFCGGVSKNTAVFQHLESITGVTFFTDDHSSFYGAFGAAFCLKDLIEKKKIPTAKFETSNDYFTARAKKAHYTYPELELKLSNYPDFTCFSSHVADGVEVDIYSDLSGRGEVRGFLGMDVGSTSTKCIITDQDGIPLAGFYTKTASRPVEAVQKLLKACDSFIRSNNLDLQIMGCGTTGSGRRISAKIIGADIQPDEITAHATAAVNLNPDVDTIIEIGGQDAKFTLLKNGTVTSSVMNTVCAAGTGSFIEEQAAKLACPLSEYSSRAQGVESPVSSDRCTVFMERDINYFFAEGHGKDEILASVLHSVRDNYLTKVANIAQIGNQILFQGATARNKALVAAFEQKLGKPIHVSPYCHLTGALGVALLVKDKAGAEGNHISSFRGFGLWKKQIPVRQETCRLCTNHCKITIADIQGSPQAYGFLCGRDYQTQKRILSQTGENLVKSRKNAIGRPPANQASHKFTLGIPQALHLFEDTELWEHFFSELGVKTITSKSLKNPLKRGKALAGAEFCAPVIALHGHVDYLMEKADFIFLPFYFEDKSKQDRRQHCYYTQFSPSILSCLGQEKNRLISPIIEYLYTSFHTKMELYRSLKTISPGFSFFDISQAYDRALAFREKNREKLLELGTSRAKPKNQGPDETSSAVSPTKDIKALLLGRPYTVLSPSMNNNIPGIFANLGVETLFQDMVDTKSVDFSIIRPLLKEIHWKHAARILEAALFAATTKDIYPVYISSFNCAPDSFAIEYFKEIMDHFNKPYLVLELDEHDSSLGYETRIEAAVMAFTNHSVQNTDGKISDNRPKASSIKTPTRDMKPGPFVPSFTRSLDNKTIIFPNWDSLTGHLLVSIFKNEGYDAVLMEETEETLKKSLLTNTGQCLPLNAIASGFIHTVKKHNIHPSRAVLWLNQSEIACNIKMYPYHINKIFAREGNGFEKACVYQGELSLFDISFKASTNAYFAYMFGGLLRSIGCKIRPYELKKGETNKALAKAKTIMGAAFITGGSKEKALKEIIGLFTKISVNTENRRPKVGIFGDLYVRDNDTMNQNLIRFIEDNGGEVVSTPYYKYVKLIANSYFKKWFKEGKYLSLISHKALLTAMQAMEKKYYPYFEPLLKESDLVVSHSQENILEEYGILQEHTGESMDNILKIHHIVQEHPDLQLLVQANPAFCCAGLVTEAMGSKLEEKTKVPIVSITYDLSGGNKNQVIAPFLTYLRKLPYSQNRKASV